MATAMRSAPGNRANATIGRALRWFLLNVGGGWPGELDRARSASRQIYLCVAENEAVEPWAPYHVEKVSLSEDSDGFRGGGGAAAQRHQP